jgi:hypothetical protein
MANIQRLTKRVKDLEEWAKENEMTGGPQGMLDTFIFLLNNWKQAQRQQEMVGQQMHNLRGLTFEFVQQHKLEDEWNDYIKEKDDAVQKQQTEEVPLQEEAESGDEAVKAPKKEIKD